MEAITTILEVLYSVNNAYLYYFGYKNGDLVLRMDNKNQSNNYLYIHVYNYFYTM